MSDLLLCLFIESMGNNANSTLHGEARLAASRCEYKFHLHFNIFKSSYILYLVDQDEIVVLKKIWQVANLTHFSLFMCQTPPQTLISFAAIICTHVHWLEYI